MNNKSACRYYVAQLNRAWKDAAPRRKRLEELSKLPDPTDEQCDGLIEWASKAFDAISDKPEEA